MFFDLHVHTEKYSPCSSLKPHDAVMSAMAMKLDGIVIVEHDLIWDDYEIEELKEETNSHDLIILRGQEITAYSKGDIQGHILTFGFYENLHYSLSAEEIIRLVHEAGGVAVAAHPFRKSVGLGELVFDLELDGIETLNSRTEPLDNKKAKKAQEKLKLPSLGGSDAHTTAEIGKSLTFFDSDIKTETDLVCEIAAKACIAVQLSDLCAEWKP